MCTTHTFATVQDAQHAVENDFTVTPGDVILIPSQQIAGWYEPGIGCPIVAVTTTTGPFGDIATATLALAARDRRLGLSGDARQQYIQDRVIAAVGAMAQSEHAIEDEAWNRNATTSPPSL